MSGNLEHCIREALERYFDELEGAPAQGLHQMVMRGVERAMLAEIMARAGGNQSQAAQMLGITRATLRKKLIDYRLSTTE